MKTRNRLLVIGVCILLLAGCQSLEIPPQEARNDVMPETAAVERTILVAMSLPRPRPPQVEVAALQPQLPEPGVPALPKSLAISEPALNRQILDAPIDLPSHPPEPEAQPASPAVPYVPSAGWKHRLSRPSLPARAPASALAPSSPAEAGAAVATVAAAPSLTEEKTVPAAPVAPAAVEPAAPVASAATAASAASATPVASLPPGAAAQSARAGRDPEQTVQDAGNRELLARKGDPIAIDLEGSGWIYTGLRSGGVSEPGEEQGVEFISSRNSRDRTSFNFKAREHGDYALIFQQQDNSRAVTRRQVVQLQVVPEQEFTAALQRLQPAPSAQPESAPAGVEPQAGPPILSADALFELGEYELALVEYTRNMRSGDPYLNDRLAECYERSGEPLAAAKYYRQNLGLDGDYGDRAAAGLVRASIATEDSSMLMEVLPSLFSLESQQIGGELLEVARFQTEDRHFSVAIQALEQYLDRYPDGGNLDEVYYRLARIYEVDSPYRDLEAARHYYGLLYESFPESLYADPAAERLDYLNRHFFLVQ